MASDMNAQDSGPVIGQRVTAEVIHDIRLQHAVGEHDQLKWTRRPIGGLIRDLKARCPHYRSDWTDAWKNDTWQQTTATICFLFFACLAPAIAFGTIYEDSTDGQMGVVETITASAIAGIVYSLTSGQPLCILGGTGPNLAYTLAFYKTCNMVGVEFLPTRVWQGLWCSLFTVIFAVTDACALMQYVTRYVEDIFSALITVIFIYEALNSVNKTFETRSHAAAFLTALLCFGTFGVAITLRGLKQRKILTKGIRFTIANFAVISSIVVMSAVARIWSSSVDIEWLTVPDEFVPTYRPHGGNARPWLLNPFGGQGLNPEGEIRDLPMWAIFFALPWGLGMAVLNYLDQNLTSLLINRPSSGIKKPVGYHLDMMVLGTIIYPTVTMLGLPFPCAATVRSLAHLISLTTYEDRAIPGGGVLRVAVKVVEQRWTHFCIHVLIGLSLLFSKALEYVPKGVLFGVFLFMGITSIPGNQLFDRLFLLMNFEPETYPRLPYVTRLRTRRLHLYTAIQLTCLIILYGLKSNKQTAVAFPFFIGALVFLKLALEKWMFTKDEMDVLDAHEDLPPDPAPVEEKKQVAKDENAEAVEATDKDWFRNTTTTTTTTTTPPPEDDAASEVHVKVCTRTEVQDALDVIET